MEWTGARYADKPTVEVQIWIDAPPQRVWAVVSDVELMPTMSQELQSIEWLDGATEPAVGARFVGHSKHESLGEWATTSEVIECEPERVLAWATVSGRRSGDNPARWQVGTAHESRTPKEVEWVC